PARGLRPNRRRRRSRPGARGPDLRLLLMATQHPGERAVQRRAGFPDRPWGSAHVGATVPPVAADFLRHQRLAVIAAAAPDGSVWASPLTGPPGFVTARDERTVAARR